MNKIYTGIGSREIPNEIKQLFVNFGRFYAKLGYTLRSGGAEGSDLSFETGCDQNNGKKEIYIPWKNFNCSKSPLYNISQEAEDIAAKFHPAWDKLTQGAKKLHSRNVYQVLGLDLKTPTDFIICYTEKGLLKGGTAQAMRIAMEYKIPILNFGVTV